MQELLATAADTTLSGLGMAGETAGFGSTALTPSVIIGSLINVVLGFTSLVFLVLMVYAGFLYLTAGGEEEKVKKAKKMIANGIIGIVLIVAAYAITSFVFGGLLSATTGTPPPG